MPKGIPLTEERLEARRREVAEAAEALFASHGFAATTMRQIAGAAGVGKSTLYDYFGAKDDVLAFVIATRIDALRRRARRIVEADGSAIDRLRAVMHLHLAELMDHSGLFLQVMQEGQRLRPQSARSIQESRDAYRRLVQTLLEQGIASGELRPVNAAMATKVLMSVMAPVVWTSRPTGTPDEMLADALDLLVGGLATSDGDGAEREHIAARRPTDVGGGVDPKQGRE